MKYRWLGAYGKVGTLAESLAFELSGNSSLACATSSVIDHCRVGLVVKNSAVVRRHSGDVFSVTTASGKLKATRKPVDTHDELWVRRVYAAVVIRGRVSLNTLRTCESAAEKFNLNIVRIK